MKKYELKYTKGEDGVFCMSTVENPATKTQLVMFDSKEEDELFVKMMIPHHEQALRMAKEYDGKVSKKLQSIIDSILTGQKNEIEEMKSIIANEVNMEFQDDDKQIIYSVAMRPNMLIPRKDINGAPAMVFYSEETVNDLQQNFFKNNSHNGATINHDKNVRQDMYCFESWIVQDPERDKATSLGLQVQKGDWVLGQKVDNPEVWQKIKDKQLTGFSIEAYLEPVLTTKEIEMTKEEIDARIKAVIEMTAEEDAAALKKKEEEDAAAAEKMKMAGEGTPPTMTPEEMQKIIDEKESEIIALKAKLAEYEVKEVEMSAEVAAAKKVAVEMGAELAKGIKPDGNASTKKYEEMSNIEKAKYNRGKL